MLEHKMKSRLIVVGIGALVVLIGSLKVARALLIAHSLAPPGTNFVRVVQFATFAPYKIAAPHLSVTRELGNWVSPTVLADATVQRTKHQGLRAIVRTAGMAPARIGPASIPGTSKRNASDPITIQHGSVMDMRFADSTIMLVAPSHLRTGVLEEFVLSGAEQ